MPRRPKACWLPKRSVTVVMRGVMDSVNRAVAALDLDGHGRAGVEAHVTLHFLEAVDGMAVDGDDGVAGFEPARLGGAAGLDLADLGRRERLAECREQQAQRDHGEEKIGRRPGDHHGDALHQPLVMEGNRLFGVAHPLEVFGRGLGSGIGVAEHLDVAAQRHGAEFPARADAVGPAENLRAKADREDFDAHAVPPRHQVMTELVNEDEHRQHDQERHDVAEAAGKKAHTQGTPIRSESPLRLD